MKRLVFHSAAKAESYEAALRYQQARAGLGTNFLDELERVVTIIRRHPQRGSRYKRSARETAGRLLAQQTT
jgi:hypothetical protein